MTGLETNPAGPAGMLGQATSCLRSGARAWIQRRYGIGDLHARQKWNVVWRELAALPHGELQVIDAGCGAGVWSFELAARRPRWRILGIDHDAKKIGEADASRSRMGTPNASFAVADFLSFAPLSPVDLVLSVASAHYLAQEGRGPELLANFASWLRPGGRLVLYGPRHRPESPVVGWLPKLSGEWGFTRQQLSEWAAAAGLSADSIQPAVGPLGTLAKQIAILAGVSTPLRAACYPFTLGLDWLDRKAAPRPGRASSAWCLAATRVPPEAPPRGCPTH
ncbi:MAG: class I SAM-dependent methyltransferase [Planctomycetaceae bacterium]